MNPIQDPSAGNVSGSYPSHSLPVVLHLTSNGVGMGHLSRQITIASAAADRYTPVLASMSTAMSTVAHAAREGELPGLESLQMEYVATRKSPKWPQGTPGRIFPLFAWEHYLRDRILALSHLVGASAIVFDGVVPYEGLLAARRAIPNTPFIWVRRGLWLPGVGAENLAKSKFFDAVIEPGDFASHGDLGATTSETDVLRTNPIALTDAFASFDKQEAKIRLGLDPDRPALLLSPGSGAHSSRDEIVRTVLAEVSASSQNWQVALTRQAVARDLDGSTTATAVQLKGVYPLSRSLTAFDTAIGAAGYNSVHELLSTQIPTLLIPGVAKTDDQQTRAQTLALGGVALHANAEDLAGVQTATRKLLDPKEQESLRDAMSRLPDADGASSAADLIADLAATGQRVPRIKVRRRGIISRLLAVPGPAALTTDMDRATSNYGEHLITDDSQYRHARELAAKHVYRS